MNVLITNTSMARGGSQTFVRALARELTTLGHLPMAYSSDLSPSKERLEQDGMPVVTDLDNLPAWPDVIHGQHHLDAMTALTALPGVPAICHSHGAIWKDCVVKHPRIYRYLAMSRTYAQRVAIESCISPDKIEIFLNGVSLTRFSRVRKLPAQPARALFFNRHHRADSATVRAVRQAAARRGLELDCLGYYFEHSTDRPEEILSSYDVVFASGLSAIEALASGCAVVILGRESCGEMVQPENFDRFREVNFSIATNSPPPSAEKIEAELRRYSPQACALVTEGLRREADFTKSVSRLVEIYRQVIEEHRARPIQLCAESLAMSRYLRRLVPLIEITEHILDRKESPDELGAGISEKG